MPTVTKAELEEELDEVYGQVEKALKLLDDDRVDEAAEVLAAILEEDEEEQDDQD
jgi:thioredoxin-like negative regulator of GroEL